MDCFVLSFIDGLFLIITCKLRHHHGDIASPFTGIPMDSAQQSHRTKNEEYQTATIPLTSTPNMAIS